MNDQNNKWIEVTTNMKRKITPSVDNSEKQHCLQEIQLSNSFNLLEKITEMEITIVEKPQISKPPPIYVVANIIGTFY
ncbi:hypothetical protein M0804_013234 [Polistes exclamans]|nr:hypothetical protein M0804_013234 [Polistes exclamans]